jgi:hypothetical protein
MRKGFIPKLSVGVALAAAALCWAPRAQADLDGAVTYTEPAGALIMPFDVTTGHESFQIVTRVGGGDNVIATHWSYWSADCKHLADVFICLTERDTIVVSPKALQSEVQSGNVNNKLGPVVDLSKEDAGKGVKGLLTVTAFETSQDEFGNSCEIDDPTAVLNNQIAGAWTIANIATNSAFANDGIGLSSDGTLPDPTVLDTGIFVQTFNPDDLEDSEVILLTVEFSDESGQGEFQGSEFGPIPRGNPKVCCDVSFVDNLEVEVSLPDFCFNCVGFAPITDQVAAEGEISIIPNTVTIDAPGFLHLTNCQSENADGVFEAVGQSDFDQFLFAFHGMAVGPFGAVVKGKYSGEPF